jgi:antitoxin ParD1/3/4
MRLEVAMMANVNLGPVFESYIQQKVATGHYNNVSEVVREALRLLMQRDEEREARLAWLRQAINDGLAGGEGEPWEGAEAIIAQARARRGE